MKKLFTVALSAVVLFGVGSCANNKPPQPTATVADASSTSPTTQTTQQPMPAPSSSSRPLSRRKTQLQQRPHPQQLPRSQPEDIFWRWIRKSLLLV